MIKFLFFLLLLPAMSFGLFDGIASFPWAIIISPLLMRKGDYGRYAILLSFLLLLTVFQLMFSEFNLLHYTKSSLALINATILLPVFLSYHRQIILKVIDVFKIYLVLTIIVGCLQLTVPSAREATSFLFGHASGFGAKGPPGLSYEPSRSALDMIYILVTCIFAHKYLGKPTGKWLFSLVVLYLLIINRSISAYLFLSIYFLLWFIYQAKRRYQVTTLIFAPFIFILLYLNIDLIDSHALNSIQELFTSTQKKELIFSLAGHRLTGLHSSFGSLSLFGEGIGNWIGVSEDYITNNSSLIKSIAHYRNVGNKVYAPLTFVGRFTLELGIFGILMYFFLLFRNISFLTRVREIRNSPEFITIVVSLVFLSYGSNPLPFICIAILLNSARSSTFNKCNNASNRREISNFYG